MRNFFKRIYFAIYIRCVRFFYAKLCNVHSYEDRFLFCTRSDEITEEIIVVNHSDIGERLFKIFDKIIGERIQICIYNNQTFAFTLKKFHSNKLNQVKWFKVEFENMIYWDTLSDNQKKDFICGVMVEMQKHSFVLDGNVFNTDECNGISDILSRFKPIEKDDDIYNNAVMLLKILGRIYFGIYDFDEACKAYLERFINNHPFYIEKKDIPYEPSIFCAFLDYYLNAEVPNIEDWNYTTIDYTTRYKYEDFIIFTGRENQPVKVDCAEYTVYDGNVKIFKDRKVFEEQYEDLRILSRRFNCVEIFCDTVYDLKMRRIGYVVKYADSFGIIKRLPEYKNIRAKEILNLFHCIFLMFNDIENKGGMKQNGTEFTWNINSELLVGKRGCYFRTLNSFYEFMSNADLDSVYSQIEEAFWNMYIGFLKRKYPKITSERALYDVPEVRFLNPYMAKSISDKFFGKDVGHTFIKKLKKFLVETFEFYDTPNQYFDPCYIYSPETFPFVFDYELKGIFGVEYTKGKKLVKELSDGRRLVLFEKATTIKTFERERTQVVKNIKSKLGDEFTQLSRIHLVTFTQLVYSKKVNSGGMYDLIGYVSTPYTGQRLSYQMLLESDNRKLFTYVGNYFANFSSYTIPFEFVTIDTQDGTFYVDTMSEKFDIVSTGVRTTKDYLNKLFMLLLDKGYNQYAFYKINPETWNSQYFIKTARSYTNYCEDHGIYYASHICPVCEETRYFMTGSGGLAIATTAKAKHYRINDQYYVKLYNPQIVDMKLAEKLVNKAISRKYQMDGQPFDYGQDCFIPLKKVYGKDMVFMGYMYEKVNFNNPKTPDYCIDFLRNFDALSNLPRLKAMIRLIIQVKSLVTRNLGFIEDPFSNVFLSKIHKKQVQIADIEYLWEGASSTDTMKWTYDYIVKVIGRDPYLDIKEVEFDPNLDKLLVELQRIAGKLTKFCRAHNAYYDADYICCPHCVSIEEQQNIPLEYVPIRNVSNWFQINEGGESIIYQYDGDSVAKVFKEDSSSNVDLDFKNKIMIKLLNKTHLLDEIDLDFDQFRFAIPRKLLIDPTSKKVYGYIMEKVSGQPISDLRDKSIVAKIGFTKKEVLEVLISVCKGIELLHDRADVYIGDLNGRNILFDKNRVVYFLDFDGMGIDGMKPEFCTDNYIDPQSKKDGNITKADDWYSFAVQAFYYLTYVHPFNGILRDKKGNSLNIIDKMERRLSLLGGHGIQVPTIAEPWDWMLPELQNEFLEIFEKGKRVSISSLLEKQYATLYGGNFTVDYNHFTRINSKMVGANKMLQLESHDLRLYRAIGKQLGIYKNNSDEYIAIIFDKRTENANMRFTASKFLSYGIYEFYVMDNDNFAVCLPKTNSEIVIMNLKDPQNDTHIIAEHLRRVLIKVVGNKIYFTDVYHEQSVLRIVTVTNSTCNYISEYFRLQDDLDVLSFDVQDENKFIFVYWDSYNKKIKVYGNDMLITSFDGKNSAQVFFDELTKTWAVVEEGGTAVLINKSTGEFKFYSFKHDIRDLTTMSFVNGKFYFYDTKYYGSRIWIEDPNKPDRTKFFDLYNQNVFDYANRFEVHTVTSKGFCLTTDKGVFEVRIG